MDKKELRILMRAREREFLSSGDPAGESLEIWRQVESLDEFIAARTVLVYMSLPGEPDTSDFIRRHHAHKRMLIPLVEGHSLGLREYDPDFLSRGYLGIVEPSPGSVSASPASVDLAIVPGVAFAPGAAFTPSTTFTPGLSHASGKGGYVRLGHGGGFYDSLLPSLRCPVVGVCFSFRVLEHIPSDPWDRMVDILCHPA